MTRYLVPGACGAIVSALVRRIYGSTEDAVIGLVVFGIVYGVILLAARALAWSDAPVLYAAVTAVAVTAAFLITGGGR